MYKKVKKIAIYLCFLLGLCAANYATQTRLPLKVSTANILKPWPPKTDLSNDDNDICLFYKKPPNRHKNPEYYPLAIITVVMCVLTDPYYLSNSKAVTKYGRSSYKVNNASFKGIHLSQTTDSSGEYSWKTYQHELNKLKRNGESALLKSLKSYAKQIARHHQKIDAAYQAGGYISSMKKEVETLKSQIAAINDILAYKTN